MQNVDQYVAMEQQLSTRAFGDGPAVFRAKPSSGARGLPSDLSRHSFERMTVDTRALSVETIMLTSMQEHLTYAIQEIAETPEQIRLVRNVIVSPRFIEHVQKTIWPKAESQIKVDVRSLTEDMLVRLVQKGITETRINGISDSGRQLIVAILGVALEAHGIVAIDIASFATRIHTKLFPTWKGMVHEGLKALAVSHFSVIKPERGLQKKAIGRVALAPLSNMFDDIYNVMQKILADRNQFNALAAASMARVLHRGEHLGDYRGITEESEIVEFASNATYILAYADYLEEQQVAITDDFIIGQLQLVPLLSFNRRIVAAASILREIEHFRVGNIDTLRRNTNIHHVLDHVGALSGVMIAPNFRVNKTHFMVSEYLHATLGRNIIAQVDMEDTLNNVLANVNDVFMKLPEQIKFVMENISERYNAGVALDMADSEVIDGVEVSDVIYPLCVAVGLSQEYLRLLAIANSLYTTIRANATEEDAEPGINITYIFDAKQKDVNRILTNISEDTCFTVDPEIVVAFGTVDVNNLGHWEVGNQNISEAARAARYLGGLGDENSNTITVLGQPRNFLERPWDLSVNVPVRGEEAISVTTEVNLYELVYASEYISGLDRDHLYVHFAPAIASQMESLVDFYLALVAPGSAPGEIITISDRIEVILADAFAPIVKSGAFRGLVASIRAQLLATVMSTIKDRAKINYVRKRLVSGELDVDISSSLLFNILRRAHLIRQDQLDDLTEIATQREYRQAMLSLVRK
jgi:hypothetical protein